MGNRKIMGIDVGIATTGWSIVQKSKNSKKPILLACGVIITKAGVRPEIRLRQIYENISEVIQKYNPEVCAIESLFYFKNQKTVIGVGQARGVLLLASSVNNLEVFSYTPLQVKISVAGYGRADKKQVQKMVQAIYGLSEVPKPDDIADAIAVSTCHLYNYLEKKHDSKTKGKD